MIPYIISERKRKSVECNVDFAVVHNSNLITLSAVDKAENIKNIFNDISSESGNLSLNNRNDSFFNIRIRKELQNENGKSYEYKLSRHDNKLVHGIIQYVNSDDYIFDWKGEGLTKTLTSFLRNKRFLPVTEAIVEKVIGIIEHDEALVLDSLIEKCEVYTSKEDMEEFNVWYVKSVELFKDLLKKMSLGKQKDSFKWDSVNSITDYLASFMSPIKNKLQDNVNILYNEQNVSEKVFEGLRPFEGQIPVVQGGLEVLRRKDNRFLYIAGKPGTGKTMMSIKVNHIHHVEKGNDNYCTMIVAPTITLTQWKKEIEKIISGKVDVIVVKDTSDFIRFYNKNGMNANKPTYLLVGKETFKLSYRLEHGVHIVKRSLPFEVEVANDIKIETRTVKACVCPDCGEVLTNPLRRGVVYLTKEDFNAPKKSNYKCSECDSVLWQASYNKTKKTSVIDFIKRQSIEMDSTILDEVHESGNDKSIIGNATRMILQRSKKSILLSGTVTNGYASSIHNVLFSLVPNTLKRNGVLDKEDFVKTYGTLIATTKNKDNSLFATSRHDIPESSYREAEGINPLVFTKYFSNNFIFVDLEDVKSEIPELKEHYIEIEQHDDVVLAERELRNAIKKASPFSASFYNESIIKHYTNKPFNWNEIELEQGSGQNKKIVSVQPKNTKDKILPKEEKLLEICKEKIELGEKVWIYNDFVTNGKFTTGESVETRLKNVLEEAGLKVYVLKSTVRTIERKDVVEKNKEKYDVFISNAELVGTGVNMQWCNNYIFYSPTYHVNTVRQASRRGLRANSTEDNNVYHLYYNSGIEKAIMERYKLKLAESEAVQNNFVDIGVERTSSNLGSQINKSLTKRKN